MDSKRYEWLLQLGLGAALIVPLMFLLTSNQWRLLVMLICLVGLIILWRISRDLSICLCFAYLLLLGDIRRIVALFAGESAFDPLLLVGASFAIFLVVPLFLKLRVKDSLSKVMLTLFGVMLLEIVNPKQSSIFVGLTAGLFWIVPILWFWIGRAYATEQLVRRLIFNVLVPLGILAAFLGLYQSFIGFLPWEQAWIDSALAAGYTSLYLAAGQIRAFGYSVSAVEFVGLLVLAIVIVTPLILQKKWIYLPFLPILLVSMFLASSRTAIVKIIFTFAAVWATRGYITNRATLLPRFIFAMAIGVAGIAYTVTQAADREAAITTHSTKADLATYHVVEGLANPLDRNKSTAGAHVSIVAYGVLAGIINPVGYGLGSVTLAAGKFSNGESTETGSSEVDISDSFIAMGVVGGVCYLLMIFFTFRYLMEYLRYGQKDLTYTLVGIFVSALGGWIAQGQYAVAPMMCFFIGFLTRQHLLNASAETQDAASIA